VTLALISVYWRNRVITPLAKRVTAENSATGEKKAPQCAMGLNGLNCITRAGGGKTTTWREKGRNKITIAADQSNWNFLYQQMYLHDTREKE
jgi:hypothetical protein